MGDLSNEQKPDLSPEGILLLREALDALATLAVQYEKDGVWMCSWCNIKCHVSREFTHTPTCIITRITAALGETDG